jgi:hypothetical protein
MTLIPRRIDPSNGLLKVFERAPKVPTLLPAVDRPGRLQAPVELKPWRN